MTLKQKIATGITLAAAGLAAISGCESMNEYDALGLASTSGQHHSQTPEEALFWGLTTDHFKTQANREDRRVVAGSQNTKILTDTNPELTAYRKKLIERTKANDPNYALDPELSVYKQKLRDKKELLK